MSSAAQENKTIAKNTLFMYFRMFLVMGVTLYTSRVVLQQLGVEDYGIYSVLGGVITLFTFFNQSMATSTQRYITYELGKKDGNVSNVFSACLKLHAVMAIVIIILAETFGLWFVNNKMVFPKGAMTAVNWTYQFSILNCVICVLRVPYNALVISHERMNFYAYSSVIEVVLKLIVVFLLIVIPSNKLVTYMAMLATVTLIISIWYTVYCRRHFQNVKIVKSNDIKFYGEFLKFSGWAMFGSIANVGYQQGVTIVINLFYGVTVNASIGIANQINAAVQQFVSGFQQAINPQLIKSEASGDTNRQNTLISMSAKFSFLIMLLIAYPLICNINYVLSLWLGKYPPMTGIIASLIIIGALLETLSGPMWVTIFATGKIRSYQVIISIILLINLPVAYLLGHSGLPVWQIFVARIIIFGVALFTRLLFLQKLISFNIISFIKKVIVPLALICTILSINTFIFHKYFGSADSFIKLVTQTGYFFGTALLLDIYIGLSRIEYNKIKAIILNKIHL